MTTFRRRLLAATALSLALPVAAADAIPGFQGLGDLPGGSVSSSARGISADGSSVCGLSSSTSSATSTTLTSPAEAFRWKGGTMTALGDLAGSPFNSAATGLSSDGNAASGYGMISLAGTRAARWVQGGSLTSLGTKGGSFQYSTANDISDDGLRVVGQTSTTNGFRGFLWTTTTGMGTVLGVLPVGDIRTSTLQGISGDGTVLVGSSSYQITEDDDGDPNTPPVPVESGSQAIRWTEADGLTALPELSGGALAGEALAASTDGSVIVGYGESDDGQEGTIWDESGVTPVGDLPGGDFQSQLNDVSGDGTLAVGRASDDSGFVAVLWTAETGLLRLDTLLSDAGIDLTGWTLTSAVGISADGDVIAGNGINPSGHAEAWRASGIAALLTPEPSLPTLTLELGRILHFPTEPGNLYQVQSSSNLVAWDAVGPAISTIGNTQPGSHAVVLPSAVSPTDFYRVALLPGSTSPSAPGATLDEGAVLGFTPQPGFLYQMKWSPDLVTWSEVGDPIDTSGDTFPNPRAIHHSFEAFPSPSSPHGFYSLEVTTP